MYIEKWHRELDRFIDIKTSFLIEGNIYDLIPYPSDEEKCDLIMLDNYLFRYLTEKGYGTVVFYNHVDGFYNEFCTEHLERFLEICGLRLTKDTKSFRIKYEQAADVIRTALSNKKGPTAVVLMYASRYIANYQHLSEDERDFYSKLLLSSLKKTQVKTEESFKNNLLFIAAEKANDIPAWFYLENPMVKTVTIGEPDKNARKMFINTQYQFFLSGRIYNDEELEKYKARFVDLTEGFKNLELNALKILCRKENIGLDSIAEAVSMYKYGIKENPWNDIPKKRLKNAGDFIKRRVKGQDIAVNQAMDIIKRASCGMAGLQHSASSKPKGILFFAGPTGTGKTELAKTLSELLFGDESSCIRFDMSEFQQSHSDQKLLGAPPGYIGYESGGQLTNAVKEKPFSILLFDEIEKAHASIFDKFLQILEDGRMTDGKGETVYFSECIIIFTSNLGIYDEDDHGKRVPNVDPDMNYDQLSKRITSSIKNYFKLKLGRPEILNRIGDNFVVFDFIRREAAEQILASQLEKIESSIKNTHSIDISVSSKAYSFLLDRSLGNLENGGRGIGNVVEKNFINPLSRYIFDNDISGGKIEVISITENEKSSDLECMIYED